jgi:L-seryl-tRNA(Ser) seleniumtransferase
MSPETANALRRIPSVDELLTSPELAEGAARVSREVLLEVTRSVLAAERARLKRSGGAPVQDSAAPKARLIQEIVAEISHLLRPSLLPVINATGVVLHTNLGRAPLAAGAIKRIAASAAQYSNLEYDLAAGARGARDVHTARLLTLLTGAQSAVVVNNNAAAVFLVLVVLARGGEVIVSRGELIEIGDGFRIPDIIAESGAALREVGTANRTRISDYERAINPRTRLILRVHRSNFRVTGFTGRPSIADLVQLGRRARLPVYEDLGSGCLADLCAHGIEEPVARQSVAEGVSLVSFSGDKLLGGPQAGIIAGNRELVTRLRRHPLFRALRVDKLTIAALEATLACYLRGGAAGGADGEGCGAIPALRMISTTADEINRRAQQFIGRLLGSIPPGAAQIELRDSFSVAGGGSTPGQRLPTRVIAIRSAHFSAAALEKRLRLNTRGFPVIARVERGRVLVDLRTVFPEQESALTEALSAALAIGSSD